MIVPKIFTERLFEDNVDEMRVKYRRGVTLEPFRQVPFVLLKRGNRVRSIVDQYFSRNCFKPKIALETENTVTALAMASSNIGIVICPELFMLDSHVGGTQLFTKRVDLFPLTDPETVSRLVLGYRHDRYLSHFAERFIQITKDTLKK